MSDAALIDQIEAIRARNNTHWMDLVRLAVELAPDRAKALLRQIAACDADVRRLTQEISRD
jgi:hypothetical protein